MKVKIIYAIQTLLAIIYLAITPLLASKDFHAFYDLKLITIYSCITLMFLVSIFFFKDFKEEYILSFKTFKTERFLILSAVIIMLISFLINMNEMKSILATDSINSNLFKGAGPNYLSVFFYWFSFILIGIAIVSLKHTNNRLISNSVVVSLILVGSIIFYQIFVNDFFGRGQNYLYGWGNSNYTPDPFSIVGLFILVPVLFKEKINYWHIGIGIFFLEIVILSSSRAAYIGLIISISVISYILLKMNKTTIKRVLISTLLAVIIFTGSYFIFLGLGFEKNIGELSNLNTLIANETADTYSLFNRLDLWIISLKIFGSSFSNIIFGMGQSVYAWDSETLHFIVSNTHNQYIDILFSGGIFVFFIFMLLLYKQYTYVIKLVKYDINNIVLLAGLIFISVKWLFNSINAAHSPFVLMVFALISYRYMEMRRNNIDS